MNKSEIIERLKNIARHAVHTVGEEPFVMSLDDGIAVHEAIEALGKDTNAPSNSALDHIHNVVRDDAYKRGYEQGKEDAAPKWIPFSEKMPKEEGDYLVTDEAAGMTETLIDKYIRRDDGTWVWLYSQNAIAWMPLPEPYKEGERNGQE